METLKHLLGNTDIYLIDQILKGRYQQNDLILDAGCGNGRNLNWFIANKISVIGIDQSPEVIQYIQAKHPTIKENFLIGSLKEIPFPDSHFNHIISSAVFHFAGSEAHFILLFEEHLRVLKSGGSFFIRMASDIGIEDRIIHIEDGVYRIPDHSTRFLLTRKLVNQLTKTSNLIHLEPFKTTNVNDIRCMSTWIIEKC